MRFLVGLFYFESFLLLYRVCWAYFSNFSDIDRRRKSKTDFVYHDRLYALLRSTVESKEFNNKTKNVNFEGEAKPVMF